MSDMHFRLKQARVAAGFDSAAGAATRFRWPVTTYSGHENGSRGIKPSLVQIYAKAFGVSAEWLMFGKDGDTLSLATAPAVRPAPEATLVSVYGVQAGAGEGIFVKNDEIIDQIAFPPSYLRQLTKADPRDLAIISVKGDSMLPTLRDEDVVMVDASKRDLSWGGIFVIKVDGEALLVKRISLGSGRGMIKIVSDNPAFPGVERRSDEIEVIGRVIWYGAKL